MTDAPSPASSPAAPGWTLSDVERATLAAALDALLPPEDSFPAPSRTGMIDEFILVRVPPETDGFVPYPGLHAGHLRALLAELADATDMTAALQALEIAQPTAFLALWRLAVFGYYSRPETLAAIQRDLAPNYHGAPLPLGYDHVIPPWDATDPLQNPRHGRGSYVRTEDVRRLHVPESAE
jgi:hypothetical protein